RAALISSNIPARFWPDTVEMYEGIHNNMPRQVPRHSQWHQLSPLGACLHQIYPLPPAQGGDSSSSRC
ncbi:MAG: hypothetical protein ACPIOQ_05195, partial [Promethearchaeia archaeon]